MYMLLLILAISSPSESGQIEALKLRSSVVCMILLILTISSPSESAQIEALKGSCEHEIQSLKRDKLLLENQLEMEKSKVETEKKKLLFSQEQLDRKEKVSIIPLQKRI